MGSIVAIWRIVVRRALTNWKMLVVLGLGVLVAATLLASAPVYARTMQDLGLTYAIREELPGGPGTRVVVRDLPIDDDGMLRWAAIEERVDERIGWFTEEVRRFERLGALGITAPGETPVEGGPGGFLQSVAGYDQHVEVLDGRLPEATAPGAPIEVVLHPEAAATAGVSIGDRLELHERLDDCEQVVIPGDMPSLSPCPQGTPSLHLRFSISAEVVGFIDPIDADDPFWLGGERLYFGIQRELPATGPWVPLWTAPGMLSDSFAGHFPGYVLDVTWNVFASDVAINRANFERARDDVIALRLDLEAIGAITASPLVQLLDRVARDHDYQQTPLILLLLQVAAIALFYVVIVSSIVVERQANEIALLRSRGASLRQVLNVYLLEGVLIGVPVLLVAPFLAAAATALAGLLPVFEPVSGGDLLPVVIPPMAFAMAALGVVLSLVALIIPAFVVARRSSVAQRRVEARPGRPLFQRYYLDLVLAGFAALLLWELNERGSAFEPSPTGGLSSDPVLLASPALTIVAAAALILRFYPMLLRVVAHIVTPAAGVSVAGGMWQVVRSPGQYTRLSLLVMMAIAVGTFAASYSTTADRSYRDRADFRAGVDLRAVRPSHLTPLSGTLDEVEQEMGRLPGVARASLAHRSTIQTGVTGAISRPVQMLAIEPADASTMLHARDDFADESLSALLFRIQGAPVFRGIPIPDGTTTLTVQANSVDSRPDFTLWARVRDANGRLALYDFGKFENTGWLEYEMDISGAVGPTMQAPLVFLGLIITEPPNRFNTQPGPIFFANLEAHGPGESIVLESFDGSAPWSVMPSLGENRDSFEYVVDASFDNRQVGRLEPRLGVQDQRRGIYPEDPSVPLVALASTGLLDRTGASVGSVTHMRVGGLLVPTRIVGSYDLFPTLSALQGPSIIYNRDQLAAWVNGFATSTTSHIRFQEYWFSLEDGATAAPLLAALQEPPYRLQRFSDRQRELDRIQRNPLVAAGGSGILQLSFIAVLMLVAAALLLSLWTAVQRRRVEFAVMRAMGISRSQVLGQLALEYLLVAILGIVVGTYLGVLVGRRMLSFLDVTERGDPVEPSFILQTDWGFVAAGGLAVLVVFGVALIVAVRVLGRTSDAQALRTE
jgi:hypothetical protein